MGIMNAVCLAIWIYLLTTGFVAAVNREKISPFLFICAALICVVHYIWRIWG